MQSSWSAFLNYLLRILPIGRIHHIWTATWLLLTWSVCLDAHKHQSRLWLGVNRWKTAVTLIKLSKRTLLKQTQPRVKMVHTFSRLHKRGYTCYIYSPQKVHPSTTGLSSTMTHKPCIPTPPEHIFKGIDSCCIIQGWMLCQHFCQVIFTSIQKIKWKLI